MSGMLRFLPNGGNNNSGFGLKILPMNPVLSILCLRPFLTVSVANFSEGLALLAVAS